MRKLWTGLVLVVLVAAAAGGYRYWWNDAGSALDIQTATVARGDVRRVVSTSGAVRALVTVEVGSQLSGQISEINADYSSEVKQGDVLARIEPSTFETKVREAEAAVAIAEANVSLQKASVTRAEATLRKAKLDFGRTEELVKRGSSSAAALDAARAARDAADADLAIAKAQVQNAEATLLQRKATLESARIDLERTYIRSPIDGVVIERAVEAGQTVAASMTAPKLFTIAQDLTRVQIDAQVDEADIGQVSAGNPVTFTVDAYPDVNFSGKVEQIRLAAVTLNNVVTYTVVIDAENPLGRLLPGMTANVEIVTGGRDNVIAVPNEALRFQPRGAAEALVRGDATGAVAAPAQSGRERMMARIERLQSALGLSAEEMNTVREAIGKELADLRASRGANAGPTSGVGQADARAQVRSRVARALRSVLTAEQYRKFEELQRRAPTGPRQQTVWTLEDGALVPHQVRVGLADGSVTEVVDGLPEGARVVTRVRQRSD